MFVIPRRLAGMGTDDRRGGIVQIQLVIGPDTGLSVGWQTHAKKNAGSADVKVRVWETRATPWELRCTMFGRVRQLCRIPSGLHWHW
jgi:hypothetical protein